MSKISLALEQIMHSKDLTVVAFIIAILAIIIIPLPSAVLDFMLSISIALSILIILLGLYIKKPTDFSSFPTLLLIVTLYRLALNVATTRMILANGYKGTDAVSDIIGAFGNFVVGGNYVIGIIIFTILVLVNLLVVTNGSTRVTEVRARFTLDAMPGKQMAIDADLNSGLIGNEEAKRRREELSQEADFYGSMDGASKFVKGDAMASIIITIVNIVGGFLIGVFQYDLSISDSASTFTILTIGDGLVGQIPALIIATATGIIVTRTTKSENDTVFAKELIGQLVGSQKIVTILGIILLFGAMIPGFPHASLVFIGIIFLFIGWVTNREDENSFFSSMEKWFKKSTSTTKKQSQEKLDTHSQIKKEKTQEEIEKEEEAMINDVLKIEILELYLGYQLIKLADVKQNGDLIERIRGMRKKIATDFGFLIPKIRIKDNLQLPPTNYEFLLKGVKIGEGSVMPDKFLAMDTGYVSEEIEGIPTKEPAFGMDALWIDPKDKENAIIQGYTIIDPPTIISTHITELIKEHASEFITKDEVKKLLERLKHTYPTIVEEANKIPIGIIRQVLQELLKEKVVIKDMITILECITDLGANNSIYVLVERVRAKLNRTITNSFKSDDGSIKLMIFSSQTESFLTSKLKERPDGYELILNIDETQKLREVLEEKNLEAMQKGMSTMVLMVAPELRVAIRKQASYFRLNISVISYAELDQSAKIEFIGQAINIDFKGEQ